MHFEDIGIASDTDAAAYAGQSLLLSKILSACRCVVGFALIQSIGHRGACEKQHKTNPVQQQFYL